MTAAAKTADPIYLRRNDNNERFVAFAFSGADLMVEPLRTARSPMPLAPSTVFSGNLPRRSSGSHCAIWSRRPIMTCWDGALSLLVNRGRLSPMLVRLASAGRHRLALAGIAVPSAHRPLRLCVTFARPPAPVASVMRAGSPQDFARLTEARMRAGSAPAMSGCWKWCTGAATG